MENYSAIIVVHPGSLCGSANMHLGRSVAEGVRKCIVSEIAKFDSARIAVVDGNFGEELEGYPYVTLRAQLSRAAFRTFGSPTPSGLAEAARRVAKALGLKKGVRRVLLTGAWNDNDGTGCVTAVASALSKAGVPVEISNNAPASDGKD